MQSVIVAPFKQGKTAFLAATSRNENPYHPHSNTEERAQWEAGYNYGVASTVIQPQSNKYPNDVYVGLWVLARAFEEQQHFSVAEELRAMAARGPQQHKGMDHFSTPEVLKVASERLAELARMGSTLT